MPRLIFFISLLISSSALAQTKAMPVTCDGERILAHDLVSGQVYSIRDGGASQCVVDNRRRLIWFVDNGDLSYLELSNGRTRKVVSGIERYIIAGNDNRVLSPSVLSDGILGGTTTLKLDSGKVELDHEPRPDPWAGERENAEVPREPKITNRKALEELAQRLPSRDRICEGCFDEAEFREDVDDFTESYETKNCLGGCGDGWAIPNSRYYMLAITDGCGDHCYQSLRLFDPAEQTYVDPLMGDWHKHDGDEPAFWSRPGFSIYFERTGRRALVGVEGDTRVVELVPFHLVIAELEGQAAGWLYPRFGVDITRAEPNDFSYRKIGADCLSSPQVDEVKLTFEVDEIGRASNVKIRGAEGWTARCVGARIVLQKWHREGLHRVDWSVDAPRYLDRAKLVR